MSGRVSALLQAGAASGGAGEETALDRRAVLRTAVTPLASIFGSGFLIIVPILERSVGLLAAPGIAGVCALAWLVGMAIRHNVAEADRRERDGASDGLTERVERISDIAIVVAYVISVALYLRILAQFVVGYVSSGSGAAERALAVVIVLAITAVGLRRGLDGLQLLEKLALAAVLVLVAAITVTFAAKDAGGVSLPPVPPGGVWSALLVLGGIVITVQGFETVRYIENVDARTRIAASGLAQLVASVVYVGFVAVATPLMGLGTSAGPDEDLLALVERVAPLLALPLVLCAALSQFSAATADTEASVGNIDALELEGFGPRTSYVVVGAVAAIIAATLSTAVVVVVASRAFAAYYGLQCLVAARTSERRRPRAGYAILGVVMLAITLLAKPAG